ncbi:MAG: hypothetical protein II221_01880 [Paludibacteraceae bacterium]|nr:hypothetical protein [Paludibacteraceae bacterium]
MEDKIIEQKWEDGALADIADALDRARGIVKTADDVKIENVKLKLLEGVNILLAECIDTIKKRAENGQLIENQIVNVDEFDD